MAAGRYLSAACKAQLPRQHGVKVPAAGMADNCLSVQGFTRVHLSVCHTVVPSSTAQPVNNFLNTKP